MHDAGVVDGSTVGGGGGRIGQRGESVLGSCGDE
eukprot:CAMPEP_0198226268 /NCGR_PEP_ID=MMETSP1445-20131203/104671_1 /TAXON_ID=36898 /ORGANISM="Pyramimonas sp., Strain CCMP2087" /LENGTH=33 /DNA_ID= /DNA_START= /DNA_END= /DNA_ORIENTATION=